MNYIGKLNAIMMKGYKEKSRAKQVNLATKTTKMVRRDSELCISRAK